MPLSIGVKEELEFWVHLPAGLSSPMMLGSSEGTIATNAFELGLGILFQGFLISESISNDFIYFHINVKELLVLSLCTMLT